MLYETAARAEDLLRLDVGDLDLVNKRARVTSKGGSLDWVHWQSGTATLLPRLLKGRTRGPVFCTDRAAPTRTPTLDVCPVTGRARLSYRRAAELSTTATRPLSEGDGWVLHQLRHSALTHEGEDDTNTRCCWPAPATPRSSRWNAMPVLVARRSPGHGAGREPAARHPPRR
jgi:integrase/recombinase XerD